MGYTFKHELHNKNIKTDAKTGTKSEPKPNSETKHNP
jgi:hypothetical protein